MLQNDAKTLTVHVKQQIIRFSYIVLT